MYTFCPGNYQFRRLNRDVFGSDYPVGEGARGVGKTTTVRELARQRNYHYVSLSDPAALSHAEFDLKGWLRGLPRQAIIDEAQLVTDLPLVLKDLVDELGAGNHFVLTGSASIGRTGLGGADPLARRALRFTMRPLTQRVILGNSRSVIADLFDAEPQCGASPVEPESELLSCRSTPSTM